MSEIKKKKRQVRKFIYSYVRRKNRDVAIEDGGQNYIIQEPIPTFSNNAGFKFCF